MSFWWGHFCEWRGGAENIFLLLLGEMLFRLKTLGCTKIVQTKCDSVETIENIESEFGGASRDRTDDLIVANDALSQLSYSPMSGWIAYNGLIDCPTILTAFQNRHQPAARTPQHPSPAITTHPRIRLTKYLDLRLTSNWRHETRLAAGINPMFTQPNPASAQRQRWFRIISLVV